MKKRTKNLLRAIEVDAYLRLFGFTLVALGIVLAFIVQALSPAILSVFGALGLLASFALRCLFPEIREWEQ